MKLKQKLTPFFITSIRIFLGIIFFTAGMSKLLDGQFPGIIGPIWLEAELAPYGLALYARFIAYSQVFVGLLLLTQRFATLGAIMLFPVILNILMVTISLEWRGTPYVNAFLLGLNLILLAADFHKLKFIVDENVDKLKSMKMERNNFWIDGLWLLGVGIIFLSLYLYDTNINQVYTLVGIAMTIFIACPIITQVQKRLPKKAQKNL